MKSELPKGYILVSTTKESNASGEELLALINTKTIAFVKPNKPSGSVIYLTRAQTEIHTLLSFEDVTQLIATSQQTPFKSNLEQG